MIFQKYFHLNNGYKMPAVGYGTWQALDSNLEKALNKALEVGYRHIDTATLYQNEHVIGKVLQQWFIAGKLKRDDVFVTTKLPPNSLRPSNVQKRLLESLENLKLDYVDMYLIHLPFGFVESDERRPQDNGNNLYDYSIDHVALWKAMETQVDIGLTKSIGLSNFNEKQIERVISNARIFPANLQIEAHVFMRQDPLVEYCRSRDIIITSFGSLGSPGAAKVFESSSPLEDSVVLDIASKLGKTAAQILLRFAIQRGIVVIPKSVNERRIEENIRIFDFELNDEYMEQLDSLDRGDDGRIFKFNELFPGAEKHPEYPC